MTIASFPFLYLFYVYIEGVLGWYRYKAVLLIRIRCGTGFSWASGSWSFYFILFIFTLIEQTYNIFYIYYSSSTLLLSSLLLLGRGPPLWCRAEIRTRACRTASRRATIWATPHPNSWSRLSKIKEIMKFHVLYSAGCSLWRAGGFFCRLEFLHAGNFAQ